MSKAQTQNTDGSFKLQQFGGMLPAWDDHLLPDGQSALTTNGYLFSGALESWRIPKLLHTTTLSNPGYVYRLPAKSDARASALLTVNAPIAGDKVTIGEEIYTFTAAVSAAYDVLLGANAAAAATNLFAALTFDNGLGTNSGVLYGVGTVANPAADQTSPTTKNALGLAPARLTVVAPDTGAAFNSTLVGETTGATRLAWTFAGNPTSTFLGGLNVTLNTDVTSPSAWMEFTDPNTDVVRSPVVDDQFDRYYMASSSLAPQYNTRARIEAGLAPWLLGIPAPGCTPTVAVAGGGNTGTIGNVTSTSANVLAPGANTIYLIPVTATGAANLNDITAQVATDDPTGRFAALFYDDHNGSPHTLIAAGQPVTGLTSGSTVASAFLNPPAIDVNVHYWIGFMTDSLASFQLAKDGGSDGVVIHNTFNAGPPAVISGGAFSAGDIQVWGDTTTSALLEARSYIYTYISEYGEESAPSPPTVVTGWSNGTWVIGLFQPPPDQVGVTRDIKFLRIYRSQNSLSGTTTYFQVSGTDGTDLPVTTVSFNDTVTDDQLVLNNQLVSQLWTPPPEGLQGFVVMPNGVIAGWKDNEIWFTEPYHPHAWPASYVMTTEYPIVGLGVTGNALVAATTGAPYVTSGVTPGVMSALKIQNSEPCHSRKSILGNTDGVYYASRNGLILVNQYGQVVNVTETWVTRERWQKLTPQSHLAAVFLVSQYYAWEIAPNGNPGTLGKRGFTVELNASDQNSFSIWPQPGGHRIGFQLLSNDTLPAYSMVEIDPWSAVGLIIASNGVYQIDFTDQAPVLSVMTWTSKLIQQKTKKNFEAIRIAFTVPPATPAQNATRLEAATDDPVWTSPLPADRYGFILVYAGDQLVTAREIREPQEVLRILDGFKHETWQFVVVSRVKISGIQIGASVKGMGNV